MNHFKGGCSGQLKQFPQSNCTRLAAAMEAIKTQLNTALAIGEEIVDKNPTACMTSESCYY